MKKQIAVKMNGKIKFERSIKELKSLRTWGIELDYNGKEKKWVISYDSGNSEQQKVIDRIIDWCWEITEIPEED